MSRIKSIFPALSSLALLIGLSAGISAQQPAPQQAASRFDVTNYRIEAQIIPDQHMLRAGADITFVPIDATRSVVFELNGSLKVESIEKNGKALTGFVQDNVGVGALGPKRSHRPRPGYAGKPTANHSHEVGWRFDFARGRSAGNASTCLCRQ